MMRQVACAAAGVLLAALLISVPVSADCVLHDGAVDVHVCTDGNGNGTPDDLHVGTPVGGVDYDEPACSGCPAPAHAHIALGAADTSVTTDVWCYDLTGQVSGECHSVSFMVDSDAGSEHLAQVLVRYDTGPGPNTWICYRFHVVSASIIDCVRIAHPVPLP